MAGFFQLERYLDSILSLPGPHSLPVLQMTHYLLCGYFVYYLRLVPIYPEWHLFPVIGLHRLVLHLGMHC